MTSSSSQPTFKASEYVTKRKKLVKPGRSWKSIKQIISHEHYERLPYHVPTYANIEAGPPMQPPKKYCDVSGLRGKYTDPRTKLRYNSSVQYAIVRQLPKETVQQYLAIRTPKTK